jgi:CheY-like chemotaxis protein
MKHAAERPRALVVEDDALIALEIVDILERDGCAVVGAPGNLPAALDIARKATIDFALLDFNLGSGNAEAVAHVLDRRAIPFALVTAYPGCVLPEGVRGRPRIQKPFTASEIRDLAEQLAPRPDRKPKRTSKRGV